MGSKKEYIDLLPAYFGGSLNEEDCLAVEEWRNETDENLSIFTESEKVYYAMDLLAEMKQYNSSLALKKLNTRINKERPTRSLVYYWQRIAAILLFPLLLASIYFYFAQSRPGKIVWQTYYTPPGVKSELQLPDGSSVYLNSDSRIEYPSDFSTKERRVVLHGEAFFNVAKDRSHPFVVDLGKIGVLVTGTKFNVFNYPNEENAEIVLAEGKVNVIENASNTGTLLANMNPGEQVVYEKNGEKLLLHKVDVSRYISWIDGLLIFRDDTMEKVVHRLERWYNVDITIANPEIKEYIFTGTFKHETISQVLDLLKRTSPIDYYIDQSIKQKNGTYEKQRIILITRK
jgi:ferric-dicitrate binding protein FerR (iron transport regulator)